MKYILTIILLSHFTIASFGDTGTLESIDFNTDLVAINFEDNQKTIVLDFSDQYLDRAHSVIDIKRINDLEYKTRVMRYFGGLLVNETHQFKDLVIIVDGKRMKYSWTRTNVNTVVNKMCRLAEQMV
jgi:hypothetical protein